MCTEENSSRDYGSLMPSFSFITILSTYHLNSFLVPYVQDKLAHRRGKKNKEKKNPATSDETHFLHFIPKTKVFPSVTGYSFGRVLFFK